MDYLDEHKDMLTKKELSTLKAKLKLSILGLSTCRMVEGLVMNQPKETWMDTDFGGDVRDGARIEVQALTLAMHHLMYRLTKDEKYSEAEQRLKAKVRSAFWDGKVLRDAPGDDTARPNVFIAAYVYPDLLYKEEWVRAFDALLPKIWCGWGGVATIDRSHPLFHKEHTGEDSRSYHRGDSWFWVNDLAAIVLHHAGPDRYRSYVEKIVAASTEEILWHGLVGHHAELSSAAELGSRGCMAQAWSAALYLELLSEVFPESGVRRGVRDAVAEPVKVKALRSGKSH
jgi:glycogen debranching enzyme